MWELVCGDTATERGACWSQIHPFPLCGKTDAPSACPPFSFLCSVRRGSELTALQNPKAPSHRGALTRLSALFSAPLGGGVVFLLDTLTSKQKLYVFLPPVLFHLQPDTFWSPSKMRDSTVLTPSKMLRFF